MVNARLVENSTISDYFVTFSLSDNKIALPREIVEKALPIVHITPLPGTQNYVMGVVNFHGDLLVVVDLRVKFGFSVKPIQLSDQLLLINTKFRRIAILTEGDISVEKLDVVSINNECTIDNAEPTLSGVSLQPDGLMLIHDLTEIFSGDEDRLLSRLLKQGQKHE